LWEEDKRSVTEGSERQRGSKCPYDGATTASALALRAAADNSVDSHLKGLIEKVAQAGSWAVWMGVYSRGWMEMLIAGGNRELKNAIKKIARKSPQLPKKAVTYFRYFFFPPRRPLAVCWVLGVVSLSSSELRAEC
jgi:hypothetical protein